MTPMLGFMIAMLVWGMTLAYSLRRRSAWGVILTPVILATSMVASRLGGRTLVFLTENNSVPHPLVFVIGAAVIAVIGGISLGYAIPMRKQAT